MTGFNKVFIDTAPLIYYLERNEFYYEKLSKFLWQCMEEGVVLVTSALTVEEYCVFPMANGRTDLIENFENFIDSMNFELVSITHEIGKIGAGIRAKYKFFKAMDALQIAAALNSGCDLFLTNDKQLKQFDEIKCVTVEEYSI